VEAVLAQIGEYRELDKAGVEHVTYYESIVQTRRQDGAWYAL